MNTFLNFEHLERIAETVAKEDPKNAQYIGMDKSLKALTNTDTYVFTAVLHNGSKAAEKVLNASYAFAADPRIESIAEEYTTDEGQTWKTIIYHYDEELKGQKIACYACIMLVRR